MSECKPLVAGPHGRVVQLDPVKPALKAHKTKRLKLINDDLLSTFASKFKLRRYTMAQNPWTLHFTDAEIEREYFALQWGAR